MKYATGDKVRVAKDFVLGSGSPRLGKMARVALVVPSNGIYVLEFADGFTGHYDEDELELAVDWFDDANSRIDELEEENRNLRAILEMYEGENV